MEMRDELVRRSHCVSAGGGRDLAPQAKDAVRIVAHIDMDAFYAQIEQIRNPNLTGKPVAVVQYPTTAHNIKDTAPEEYRVVNGSASSIIAVSYEARAFGVKRNMKGGEAKKACNDLNLVQVPTRNGKADLTLYRHNGEKVVSILEEAGGDLIAVEKASIDEVYVDVTRAAHVLLASVDEHCTTRPSRSTDLCQRQSGEEPGGISGRWQSIGSRGGWAAVMSEVVGTYVAAGEQDAGDSSDEISWWTRPEEAWDEEERLLACGAAIVSKLRAAVRKELKYSCTAGIAHNKLLAKLCSNMHKPNAQTVLPATRVPLLFSSLPVEKIRGWGGKLGVRIKEKLGVTTAGEVAAVGPSELQRALGEVEGWRAWEKSRGLDKEPVKARSAPKSVGCSKTFPGKSKLTKLAEIQRWLSELSKELCDRLAELVQAGGRTPRTLTVIFDELPKKGAQKSVSRCCRMVKAEVPLVVEACLKMLKGYYARETPALTMLGVSAHGFEDTPKDTPRIESFFSNKAKSGKAAEMGSAAFTAGELWVGAKRKHMSTISAYLGQANTRPAFAPAPGSAPSEAGHASAICEMYAGRTGAEGTIADDTCGGAGSEDAPMPGGFYDEGEEVCRGEAAGGCQSTRSSRPISSAESSPACKTLAFSGLELASRQYMLEAEVEEPKAETVDDSGPNRFLAMTTARDQAGRSSRSFSPRRPLLDAQEAEVVLDPSEATSVACVTTKATFREESGVTASASKETFNEEWKHERAAGRGRGEGLSSHPMAEQDLSHGEWSCVVKDDDGTVATVEIDDDRPEENSECGHFPDCRSVREDASRSCKAQGIHGDRSTERTVESSSISKNYAVFDGTSHDAEDFHRGGVQGERGQKRQPGPELEPEPEPMSDSDMAREDKDGVEKKPQLLFGTIAASGGFGVVDPDVLAELPPDIQREVWMQQGSQGAHASGGLSGTKRLRTSGQGTSGLKQRSATNRRGGVRGGRGLVTGQGSISSFFCRES